MKKKEQILFQGDEYSISSKYDRILKIGLYKDKISNTNLHIIEFKNGIFDLDTNEFTSRILNLGKELLNYVSNSLQNTYIQFDKFDFLKQELIVFDMHNNFIIKNNIINWYKNNLFPFDESKIDYSSNDEIYIFEFAALCIRLYIIVNRFDKINKRKNEANSTTKYGINNSNQYFIFNDYILENMDEKERDTFAWEKKKINHNIDDDTILRYINRLFNDINKKYDLFYLEKKLIIDENNKNIIQNYYSTPISCVINHIAKHLCNEQLYIRECEYCGYYMETNHLSQRYHEYCLPEVDRIRKRKNDRS